jgi:hypothetical protein
MIAPPGWKLVPIEPTAEMLEAAHKLIDFCAAENYGSPPSATHLWEVMVGAAPDWQAAK